MAKVLRFRRKKSSSPAQQSLFSTPWFEVGFTSAPPRTKRPVPTDARPSRLFRTDARPSPRGSPSGNPDPEVERRRRFKRSGVMVLFAVVFVAGTAAAFFGPRGYLDVRRSRKELEVFTKQVEAQRIRVRDLRAEVKELQKNPGAVERIAREELGFIRPGEITFLLPYEDAGPGMLRLPPRGPSVKPKTQAKPVIRD